VENLEIYRDKNITYKDIMQKKIRAIDNKFKFEIANPGRRENKLNFKPPVKNINMAYKAVSSNMNMDMNQNYVSNLNKEFNSSLNSASYIYRRNKKNNSKKE